MKSAVAIVTDPKLFCLAIVSSGSNTEYNGNYESHRHNHICTFHSDLYHHGLSKNRKTEIQGCSHGKRI